MSSPNNQQGQNQQGQNQQGSSAPTTSSSTTEAQTVTAPNPPTSGSGHPSLHVTGASVMQQQVGQYYLYLANTQDATGQSGQSSQGSQGSPGSSQGGQGRGSSQGR